MGEFPTHCNTKQSAQCVERLASLVLIICTAFTININTSVTEVIEVVITEFNNIDSVQEKNGLRETHFFRLI